MIMSNALHQAYGLLDGTVKVGVVAELGRLYLRHRNAGKGPYVAREGQRHLRTQGIDELGMARDAACDHKDLGVEHGLQVDELSVKGASVAVERALHRLVAIRDPLKDAAAVHRKTLRQALLGNDGITERTPTARTRKGVFRARGSRDIVAQEAELACKAVRAAQDLAVDDDAAADTRANSEHHAKTRPAQGASRILTERTALTVVIDGNRHPSASRMSFPSGQPSINVSAPPRWIVPVTSPS